MASVVIFGTGACARLAQFYFFEDSAHEVVAFCVDDAFRTGSEFLGLPLVSFEEVTEHYPPADHRMFIAIGYAKLNKVRAEKYAAAKALGYELASYVSSRCTYLTDNVAGDNCFILEDNTVQPFVQIGNNVTLWSGNHIGHDSVIEDHCFLTSHVVVSGHCRVGAYSFIGVNATLRDGIRVAERCLIGAGSVVMKDTVANGVYVPEKTRLLAKNSQDVDI